MRGKKIIKLKEKFRIKHREVSILNRLTFLFFIIVTLFSILLFRLFQMQILDKEFYDSKLKASTTYKVKTQMLRGKIYDANDQVIVSNQSKKVVVFTRNNLITAQQIKKIAQELSQIVSVSNQTVSTRAKKDYFLADDDNYQAIIKKLPNKEKFDYFGNKLRESDIYANAVKAVSDDQINYSEDELKSVYLFNQMNGTPTFNSVTLSTSDLTDDQIAAIQQSEFQQSGITIASGWNRQISNDSLASIIGSVSSQEAGLPEDQAKSYLKKGYALNDRVGTSYLEKEYESYLQGKHKVTEVTTNKKGKIVNHKVTTTGQNGDNLKLTIRSDFQSGVESILSKYYQSEIANGDATYSPGVYAVAIDPSTGSILSLAGFSHETGSSQITSDALGTLTDVFTPGSVVKGATLAAGWKSGVISGNQVLYDQPIQFAGSQAINSWFTSGQRAITAVQALEYSSNTYMVQVALKMMGQEYYSGMSLTTDGMQDAMTKLRSMYGEFGLGVDTGIDIPGASTGYVAKDYTVSNVVTEAFGQFDNYSPLQLAQYIATVANGGSRIAPHIVEGIYQSNNDELGQLEKKIDTKVLNKISITPEQLSLIQQGFYQVVNSNDAYATGLSLQGGAVTISAKTGTAETYATNSQGQTVSTYNLNVIAYDSTENPKIAVAVMYPNVTSSDAKAHELMARDIISLYHSMNQ